jgi:hypothetical protein
MRARLKGGCSLAGRYVVGSEKSPNSELAPGNPDHNGTIAEPGDSFKPNDGDPDWPSFITGLCWLGSIQQRPQMFTEITLDRQRDHHWTRGMALRI